MKDFDSVEECPACLHRDFTKEFHGRTSVDGYGCLQVACNNCGFRWEERTAYDQKEIDAKTDE